MDQTISSLVDGVVDTIESAGSSLLDLVGLDRPLLEGGTVRQVLGSGLSEASARMLMGPVRSLAMVRLQQIANKLPQDGMHQQGVAVADAQKTR